MSMWKFFISAFFVCVSITSFGQSLPIPNDTLRVPKEFGLRAGVDVASLIKTAVDDTYTGFQIQADYRITQDLYVAGELGIEDIERQTDRIDYKTSGSFFKAGIDYNFYNNWLDMDNMLYVGPRVGVAQFSQELNRFNINQDNTFFPIPSINTNQKFDSLNAIWFELQVGMKVEVFNNIYLNANIQLKRMITTKQPENFDNLYVPGFGKTNDNTPLGFGFGYGISYRIPLYSK